MRKLTADSEACQEAPCTMQYQGYEPGADCLNRDEEAWEDWWMANIAWRRWLASRGYLNRRPRDRGYRRHQRARVIRRLAPAARGWWGSDDARAVSKLQGLRLQDPWWEREAAKRRARMQAARDAGDNAA